MDWTSLPVWGVILYISPVKTVHRERGKQLSTTLLYLVDTKLNVASPHVSRETRRVKKLWTSSPKVRINTFIAPACKISGLNVHAHAIKQYLSWGCDNLVSIQCVLMKIPRRVYAEKETKMLKDFKFCIFACRSEVTSWQWKGTFLCRTVVITLHKNRKDLGWKNQCLQKLPVPLH